MQRLHRFDPSPCAFPSPRIPLLAPPRWAVFGRAARPAAGDARQFQHHARGRYALRAALQCAGLREPADTLLLPAYHCRTMVDPALDLGLRVETYPLHADLSVDLDALDGQLQALQGRRVAVLLTHYFGFAQPQAAAVRRHCDAAGAVLIEDASHAFVLDPALGAGPQLAAGIGSTADIGIASPYKFLPCPDGGLLWQRGHAPLPAPPAAASWRAELRALLQIGRSMRAGTAPPRTALAHVAAPAREWTEALEAPTPRYLSEERGRAPLRLSRWVMRHAQVAPAAAARRRHYERLAQGLSGLQGARPLLPRLDADTVPYMFPLLLDDAEPHFSRLKADGLPIWRWDELMLSPCPISQAYRLRLLHLPCHDALGPAELDWMIERLRAEFGAMKR